MQTRALPAKAQKTAAQWEKELDELPDPFAKFYEPETSAEDAANSYEENGELRAHHAHTWFRERRARAIEQHEQIHGASRDFVTSYTQKTHDQIQTQIFQLYGALYDERAAVLAHLKEANARIDELERKPKGLEYRGVYSANETYEPSDVVTWSGSAWFCKRQTTDKPGEGDRDTAAWQLMVKKGRDGRDVRNAA